MKLAVEVGVPAVTFLVMTIVGLDLTRAAFKRGGVVPPRGRHDAASHERFRGRPGPALRVPGARGAAVAITLLGDTRFAVFATTYFVTEAVPILAAVAVFRLRSRAA